MVKLIAFDLDGTLVDSRLDLAGAVNYMRGSMGIEPLTAERVVSFVGNGVEHLVRRSIADTEINFDEALKRMKGYYAEHLVDTTALYPGVADGVRALRLDGVKLALVSNKPTGSCRRILTALGIADFFNDIIGGDSDYPLKPEPDSLNAIREKYGFDPADCWILGDHYTDLEAGRRAGFHRALARYGFGDPREEKADTEAASFTEFVEFVKHL